MFQIIILINLLFILIYYILYITFIYYYLPDFLKLVKSKLFFLQYNNIKFIIYKLLYFELSYYNYILYFVFYVFDIIIIIYTIYFTHTTNNLLPNFIFLLLPPIFYFSNLAKKSFEPILSTSILFSFIICYY